MTTENALPDFGPMARGIALLAANVGDDRLTGPTPCPEYRVRNLLGHLLGLSTAFRDAARKDLGPTTGTNPGSFLPDVDDAGEWRERLPEQLDEMAAAWRDPAAWEGMTQAGGVSLPGAVAGRVALNELTVHGWDLARATGQPYAPDQVALESSLAMLAPLADAGPGESPFGPAVPVAEDAPLLDRVIALSGRNPAWAP
jgi:uncharacterized protein (TIGR03086 family)